MSWSATWTFPGTFASHGDSQANYLNRTVIPAAQLSVSGPYVRITLQGRASAYKVDECYIGHAAGAGDPYDFDGNQVRITFDSGSNGCTVAAGVDKVSDGVTFALDKTKNLVLSFYTADTAFDDWPYGTLAGINNYYKSGANAQVGTTDVVTGYLLSSNLAIVVSKVEVSDTAPSTATIDAIFPMSSFLYFSSYLQKGLAGDTEAHFPIEFLFSVNVQNTPPAGQITAAVDTVFPIFTIDSQGIASIVGIGDPIVLPKLTGLLSGIVSVIGSGECQLRTFSLSSAGAANIIGTALISLPRLTLIAEQRSSIEGAANISLPRLSASGLINLGIAGSLDCDMPLFKLSASGLIDVTGAATINLPALMLLASSLPDSYLAMVLNIKNKALTLYDNYQFNSLCRFNGKNLGATPTGIFDLDQGDTDDGTIIEWNFRTGYLDLEQKQKKKLKQAWLSYKSTGDLMLTVITPTGEEYEYISEGFDITETGMRVKFGKGIRSKYVALDIKNIAGSTITLDTLRLHLDKTSKPR